MPLKLQNAVMFKEAMMKKSSAAVLLCMCLLISIGCSSAPSGTVAVHDLQPANAAKYLGQNIVVVGSAEIRSPRSPEMFRLTDKYEYIWVLRQESTSKPPQGYKVQVTGTLKKGQQNLIGDVYYIDATKVEMD
jgi:hypothetical protein